MDKYEQLLARIKEVREDLHKEGSFNHEFVFCRILTKEECGCDTCICKQQF